MDANEKRRRAEDKRAGVFADELTKIRRRRAALEAKETRLLADAYALTLEQRSRIDSASSRERDMPLRSMALELGMAVRVNDRSMQTQMHDAHELIHGFPQTMEALVEGRVTRAHAQVIQDAGRVIEDATDRATYERVVLVEAEAQLASAEGALGLSDDPGRRARTVAELAFANVSERGPGHFHRSASPGAWRDNLNPEEQERLTELLGPKLTELGYESGPS